MRGIPAQGQETQPGGPWAPRPGGQAGFLEGAYDCVGTVGMGGHFRWQQVMS